MTKEDAEKLKRFDHHCTCGGFAWRMNGRPEADPHMKWCPQKKQYDEWWAAMNGANSLYKNIRRPDGRTYWMCVGCGITPDV